jgi:phosphoribosylformimino-5-aminoimidazole carboxamide ribotide isomerase
MDVIPAIEIQNGRCVSLYRGRMDEPHIWHVDPIKTARNFAHAGASWLHVTDFDAVAGLHTVNATLVRDLILAAEVPLQLGGGIETLAAIGNWIEAGVGRIVLGSAAVNNPEMVKEAAHTWPDQIVVAVDVFEGMVMSGGWRNKTAFDPVEFIANFADAPLAAMIVTDIDADIEDADASLALITRLAGVARAPVIARGTVRGLDDISRLKYVPKVAGAIVSRALFNKSLDLAEALSEAEAPRGLTPKFV